MIYYSIMNRPTNSEKYRTVRISYPPELDLKCTVCGSKVKFLYPDNGKVVHTLKGDVYQVVNLYTCTDEACAMSEVAFNPSPRFDYSGRHFGADVFSMIAEEFLIFDQKSDQIYKRLAFKHRLSISPDTVRRMCDDVLTLKSLKIDEKTVEIIQKQGFILLALDGQDPGGAVPSIWCFIDLISNRVLATRKFDSLDHETLRDTIEELKDLYGVEIVGWVSDKQNLIIKCHDTFYPEIPHQYCQYHFLRNLWNHLAKLDSKVYLPLKKAVNGLYIHSASKSAKVNFENVGKVSVREAFENTDDDLQAMIRVRNKTFKELRGIWLYETLDEYVGKMEKAAQELDPSFRFTKIMTRTIFSLQEALDEVKKNYEDACLMQEHFQEIRETLGDSETSRREKEERLGYINDMILMEAKQRDPSFQEEDCKAFLPSKNRTTVEVMGEWHRLWKSYLPGLFVYYGFSKPVRTNMELERLFSKQKQAIFNRAAKSNVCRVVSTRGEDYLRIKYCDPEELQSDIIAEYSDEVVRELRAQLVAEIKDITERLVSRSRGYKKFDIDIKKYYHQKGRRD
ncbi:MAG: hypothetical protein GF353_16010 [Candidatus Lokiarchaeota archaeon]|nr:hypothetical protein [Candidatus Lokiarchaeota archaeon]MBD3352302.1 hypothetical protein [Candidatus Lokiarchaeota archaeon]